MADLHDSLEQALDRLAPGPAVRTAEPPAAFLAAVGRRRTQRRLRVASVAIGVTVMMGVGAFVLSRSPGRGPTQPASPIADAMPFTIGSVHERVVVSHSASGTTMSVGSDPAVLAADWRNEAKLAALVGSS